LSWREHEEEVYSLDFSPDGKYLAATSGTTKDGGRTWKTKVLVKDLTVNTGVPARVFEAGLAKLAFSPDGRHLAIAEIKVDLWDVSTGKVVKTFTPDKGHASVAAFSKDGKVIAGGGGYQVAQGNGTVSIGRAWTWDAGTGEVRRTFENTTSFLRAIALSPDSTRLAVAGVGPKKSDARRSWIPAEIKVLNAATGAEVWTWHGAPGDSWAVVYSPDGKTMIFSDADGVYLCQASTGEVTKVLMAVTKRQR
jgi:WD40 repeat protein